MLSLKIIYKLDFQLIIAKIGYMGKDLNLRLIIRGSQDHALVGPQPKGKIFKGLCCKRRRPFLFGVILGQVLAKFCVFRGRTEVNGGERVELLEPD